MTLSLLLTFVSLGITGTVRRALFTVQIVTLIIRLYLHVSSQEERPQTKKLQVHKLRDLRVKKQSPSHVGGRTFIV